MACGQLIAASLLLGSPGPAEQSPHPGFQLQDVEGLCEIVVRPALEADDLVRVLPLGGEHDDRHVGELPDAHACLEAVDLGHHHVQDDQVEAPLPGQLHRFLSVIGVLDLVALVLQVELDALYQHPLVVHDQNLCHCVFLLTQRVSPVPPLSHSHIPGPGCPRRSPSPQ